MNEQDKIWSYPNNQEYYFKTSIRKVNLDEERKKSLLNNRGFVIKKHQSINKDFKEPDSIYSYRYGQTLQDLNPYQDRYKCK